MRMFNQVVLETQVFSSQTGVYSEPQYNALLGSAEAIVIEGYGEQATGTPSVNISTEHSNDNKNWVALTANVVSGVTPTTSAASTKMGSDTARCGAYRRLAITISGSSASCLLRITVCGRGEQAGM
jgi:hypothetical protein